MAVGFQSVRSNYVLCSDSVEFGVNGGSSSCTGVKHCPFILGLKPSLAIIQESISWHLSKLCETLAPAKSQGFVQCRDSILNNRFYHRFEFEILN